MAQMWHYINFFSYKPTKIKEDFRLYFELFEKNVGGAITEKTLKTNTKTLISSI